MAKETQRTGYKGDAAQRAPKPLPFRLDGVREGGVLLHVTSLPTAFGIGDFGPAALEWIDRLADARQAWWQILPLGPPASGNSPYQCTSAFAGNPLLISPQALVDDGLLGRDDLPTLPASNCVDYAAATRLKQQLLRTAWHNFQQRASTALRREMKSFEADAKHWLDDFATFAAIRAIRNDESWANWPRPLKARGGSAMTAARAESADAICFERFVQFIFARQWAAVRRHARQRGVGIIGDIPIFIGFDSADVWANPKLFQLDSQLRPRAVAGVPPDAFSRTGQRWGNPLYDWSVMADDDYAWWAARLAASFDQADAVRLDHFRGFDAYWRIPASAATAETGRWLNGPGEAFFESMRRRFPSLPMIAEDLGVITPRVTALRDAFDLPGMRVLQFAFGDMSESIHAPHRVTVNSVVYPGTHDNDTTVGWFESLDVPTRRRFLEYAGCLNVNNADAATADPAAALLRLAWASVGALAIAPLQDVLSLPTSARMNRPGTATDNWDWRIARFSDVDKGMDRLAKLAITYARV